MKTNNFTTLIRTFFYFVIGLSLLVISGCDYGVHKVSVAKTGNGDGVITDSKGYINCGSVCFTRKYSGGIFSGSVEVVLSARANENSIFNSWSGDSVCSKNAIFDPSFPKIARTTVKLRVSKKTLNCTAKFDTIITKALLSVSKTGMGNGVINSTPAGISCGTDCDESYAIEDNVVLTVTPDSNSVFTGWSGDAACVASASENSTSVEMNANINAADVNINCVASFELAQPPPIFFQLTVTKSGDGDGTVRSTPIGIDCGIDCEGGFAPGTDVTLSASEFSNSAFAGWGGDAICSQNANGRMTFITLNSNTTCTAIFNLKATSKLIVSKSHPVGILTGDGVITSSPGGINCGTDCEEIYAIGTSVTLTATPDSNSDFLEWTGEAACINNAISNNTVIVMDKNRECRAVFAEAVANTSVLTVSITGAGVGSVQSNPAGINCYGDCYESFNLGTNVVLTATAVSNSVFTGWSGDSVCSQNASGNTTTVTINSNLNCIATFDIAPTSALLTVSVAGSGEGFVVSNPAGISCGATSTDCSEIYSIGASVILTANPNNNSVFTGWSGDAGCSMNVVDNISTVIVSSDMNCIANFDIAPQTSQLTVSLSGSGNGFVLSNPAGIDCGVDCVETYNRGSVVTLTATELTGSSVVGWGGDAVCSQNATGNTTTVTMNSDINCTAIFDLNTTNGSILTLTILGGPGAGEVRSDETPIPIMDCINSAEPTTVCTAVFQLNAMVGLRPSPFGTATSVIWTGCDQDFGIEGCLLTMDQNRSVTVTFQ